MITLCGTPLSNYYNKVKLVLLEKGVPFTEEAVSARSKDEAVLAATPLGKVPFVKLDGGTLCESQVIVDYLEARFPQPPLVPADPLAAAKVREICAFVELYVEWVAREIYGQAFFGGSASDETRDRVRRQLERNVPALRRLAPFSAEPPHGPFAAGAQFTLADAAAYAALPIVAQATQAVYGEDLVAAGGIDWKAYLKRIGDRPSVQRVGADRKRAAQAFAASR